MADNVRYDKPLVSIIIPVYNGSNFMREAIDSALAQTYPNIEILVINDGSTDNTREIALSYGDKIRYFEKENGGVATALNLGIREMRGEYFSWLSHDDWYAPNKISAEIEALQRIGEKNLAVYSECDFVKYPSGESHKVGCLTYGKERAEIGWFAVAMGLISGCTLLIPRVYFEQYGGFDEKVRAVNDYEQWFRMFADTRLVYVNESLVGSRVHDKQVTVTYTNMYDEDDQLYSWMTRGLSNMNLDRAGIDQYLLFGFQLARFYPTGKHKKTSEYILDCIRKWKEPDDADKKRKTFCKKLRADYPAVYVYCAGRIAKRFIMALQLRGVVIDGVSDSNNKLWGKTVASLPCVPPSEIPKDALVLLANAYPDKIAEQLKAQGIKYIQSYMDWRYDILMTPIKRELCESL